MRLCTLWLAMALRGGVIRGESAALSGPLYRRRRRLQSAGELVQFSGDVAEPKGGAVGLGSVGYALGNGFRFEIEGNYRWAGLNRSAPR